MILGNRRGEMIYVVSIQTDPREPWHCESYLLFSLSGKNMKNIIILKLKLGLELETISGMSGVKIRNGELILLARMRSCHHQKIMLRWLPESEQEEVEPGLYEESLPAPSG